MAQDAPDPGTDTRPQPERRNGQGEHEGKAHSPSEFDPVNPAKSGGKPDDEVQEQL